MNDHHSLGWFGQTPVERKQWACHVGTDGLAGFDFNQPHFGIWSGYEEINFKALMIPEEIQLFSVSTIDLVFQNFRCNKTLEEGPQERRAFEFG